MTSEEILRSDMLDLLFEGRNKNYGAYELRRKYDDGIRKALLTGILLTASVFAYSFYIQYFQKPAIVEKEVEIIFTDYNIPVLEVPIPELPKPKPVAQSTTVANTAPVVRDRVTVEDEIPDKALLENSNPGVETTHGVQTEGTGINVDVDGDPGIPAEVTKVAVPVEEDDKIRNYVEQMPEFPGGINALYKWLNENVKYPKEAIQNKLEGKVITQFTIEKDGSVTNVNVVRDGVGGGAGAESIRVVQTMPPWKAGKQNGRPVRVMYTLPIGFALN